MACERVDITVLVVDDDVTSLAIVANILSSWDYKVLTANSARNALETLREFEGFFNLVITEVHISGMNGLEFQKRVKDEFQLPVIMMSADNRKSVMSKSLKNGAALYLLKPICANDFKDIWKYAMAARKGKLVIQNELRSGEGESPGEKIIIRDVNSSASSSVTHEPKRRRKYSKRKSTQMNKEHQSGGSSRVLKKQKIVWTTYLHNLFLLAIKHIGLDKAVPKKILEIMNVPYLTRENVASHLQKYRIFLRKVAEKGILEGLSDRALRSMFASGLLSASMIKDIQTRTQKLRAPVQQYLKSLTYQAGNGGTANAPKVSSNQGPISLHDQLGRSQFPNPLHRGLMLQNHQAFNGNSLNQVRLGQPSFGSNIGANNIQQKMLGSYATNPVYQANHSLNNAAPIFPSYGMENGLMISSNGLTGGLKYGNPMYQNYGSLGNHSFKYDLGNGNMTSLSSSTNLPWSSTCYPRSKSSGVQLNGGSEMVGTGIEGGINGVGITAAIANNNSFGLINGTQNANMHVATTLGYGNYRLVQGRSAYASPPGDGNASELPAALITNANQEENISGIPQLPQQLDSLGNAAGNEHHYDASSSINKGEASQLEDDLSELFLMLEDLHLLNETEETPDASEFSSSCHLVQSVEQPQTIGDVIVPPTKSSMNQQNESPKSSDDKNANQLQGNGGFADWKPFDRFMVDSVSTASNSATEQDWDMELIEAFFGTKAN